MKSYIKTLHPEFVVFMIFLSIVVGLGLLMHVLKPEPASQYLMDCLSK